MSDFNPYQQPQSEVASGAAAQELAVHAPVRRSFGSGMGWISDAWGIYTRNWGLWIGGFIVIIFIGMAAGSLPFIGPFVGIVLNPLIYAGFYIVARNSDYGQSVRFEDFFAGFQGRVTTLLGFGLASLGLIILTLVFAAVMFWLVLGDDISALMSGFSELMADKTPSAEFSELFVANLLIVMLLYLLVLVPYMAAVWFGVPLIALNDNIGIGQALKWSLVGCIKNFFPMILYSILLMLLLIAGMIPLFLGLLIVGPVMTISLYTSYRDIYVHP